MPRDWESWVRTAARPASRTEEEERDRTFNRVRDALRASPEIPSSVRSYVKGSYATNTNVRRDADVDIAVEWTETAYVNTWGRTAGLGPSELGYTPVPRQAHPLEGPISGLNLSAPRQPSNGIDRVALEGDQCDLARCKLWPARPCVSERAGTVDVVGQMFAEVAHQYIEAHSDADPCVRSAEEQVRFASRASRAQSQVLPEFSRAR